MEFTAGGARIEETKIYADWGIHRLTVAIRACSITEMQSAGRESGALVGHGRYPTS
jgi:hypothetical protein